LILRLENIPEHGLDLRYEEGKEWFEKHLKEVAGADCVYGAPILVHLLARRSVEKEIFLTGSITMEIEMLCSRCLERFRVPIVSEVNYAYLPESEGKLDTEWDPKDLEGPDMGYYNGEKVELSPLVAEQLLLDIPRFPICREDCRGLCPQCGINLKEKVCHCAPMPVEGPFSTLKGFKSKKG
jgi:uncharacterized protein